MKTIISKEFSAENAWEAMDIASLSGTYVHLHWTDKPYKWHINEGQEVFTVMDGVVEMLYKEHGDVKTVILNTGDLFLADQGCEHVACPKGEARIVVIEKEGSV